MVETNILAIRPYINSGVMKSTHGNREIQTYRFLKMLEPDFLEEINAKYVTIENELDHRYKKLLLQEERENSSQRKQEKANQLHDKSTLTLEEAKKRNSELIKSLEMAKARLRSRSTYSPIETILEKAVKNYSQELSGAKQSCDDQGVLTTTL